MEKKLYHISDELQALIDWDNVMSMPRYAGGHDEQMKGLFKGQKWSHIGIKAIIKERSQRVSSCPMVVFLPTMIITVLVRGVILGTVQRILR